MDKNNSSKPHRIGFVGGSDVGKTSLIYRLTNNIFLEGHPNSIAIDFSEIIGEFQNYTYHLQVFDIAGLKKNHDLTVSFLAQTQAVVLAFDLSEQDNELEYWMKIIQQNTNQDVLTYIVGCKADKVQLDETFDQKINDIVQIAQNNQNFNSKNPIFKTSSKTGYGVQELLEAILKDSTLFQVTKSKLKSIQSKYDRQQNQNQTQTIEAQPKKEKWYTKIYNSLTSCQFCEKNDV